MWPCEAESDVEVRRGETGRASVFGSCDNSFVHPRLQWGSSLDGVSWGMRRMVWSRAEKRVAEQSTAMEGWFTTAAAAAVEWCSSESGWCLRDRAEALAARVSE